MPKLVITEKPSVAQTISQALGGFSTRDGYLESSQYLVTWAIGHLADHGRPEDYDPKYKRWNMADLPIVPDSWRMFPRSADARKQLKVIGNLAKRCSGIINACDSGREGELIYRNIAKYLRLSLPLERLWISSLTKEAVVKGFADLRPGAEFDNLYASAEARARGDWLVGLNSTRAFTLRFSNFEEGVLSVGRVQTPTLAILVQREQEISEFVPEDYFVIKARLSAAGVEFGAHWEGEDGPRIRDEATALALAEKIASAGMATVTEVKVETVKENQPQLFDLTSLQREANRRLGLTAKQTLDAAQALYEAKLITYPRTDSRYLTEDMVAEIPKLMANLLAQPAYQHLRGLGNLRNFRRPAVVNDKRVTDHHAIIPTDTTPPASLDGRQVQVYDLIARRFIANALPPAEDRKVRLIFDAVGETLIASGTEELVPGWRVAEPRQEKKPAKGRRKAVESEDEEEENGQVPDLQVAENAFVEDAQAKRKTTKPPHRMTEAMLLGAMEGASRELDDEDLKQAMRGKGLGTPATRAAIIERLKAVGYVEAKGKTLIPTAKGIRLIQLVEEVGITSLTSPELTAEWELRLNEIAAGKERLATVMGDLNAFTAEIIRAVNQAKPSAPVAGSAYPPCPLCGSPIRSARYGVYCTSCTLKINKSVSGRLLAEEDLHALLTVKKTALLGGFVSKRTGNTFSAILVLKTDGSGVEFDFSQRGEGKPAPTPAATPSKAPAKGRRGGGRRKRASGEEWARRPGSKRALLKTGISERQ